MEKKRKKKRPKRKLGEKKYWEKGDQGTPEGQEGNSGGRVRKSNLEVKKKNYKSKLRGHSDQKANTQKKGELERGDKENRKLLEDQKRRTFC